MIKSRNFWFALSLVFTIFYGFLALRQAFSSEYIVQDDARQHVFWMLRFINPNLFPNDLIADYFQSVAPAGYKTLYRLAAMVGINPLVFNKLLPPVLAIVTTAYCFQLSYLILPIPVAGFITSLLLNQNIWFKDDLISATPRAFAYVLLLAFLYYLARRSLIATSVAIALLSLFYPQCVFLCSGMLILQLVKWQDKKLKLTSNRQDYRFCLVALTVAFIFMLPYALTSSEFGPVIEVTEAKQLPEFLPGGRSVFFRDNWFDFYFKGGRSGMFPKSLFTPATLCLGLLLPLLLSLTNLFTLSKKITPHIYLIPQLFITSVVMFIAAHAVLFKLHLPSRYTGYSFRIIIALMAGMAFTLVLDALLKFMASQKSWFNLGKIISFITVSLLVASVLIYPLFIKKFPVTKYKVGNFPALYQYFQQQPVNIVIASIAEEANNLPTFARRSILVGREYAIPYHLGYYRPFRQRFIDLINAQYSSNWQEVIKFIDTYKIDFWLLERGALSLEYIAQNKWLKQYQPATQEAQTHLEMGQIPALATVFNQCTFFENESFVVLDARCLKVRPQGSSDSLGIINNWTLDKNNKVSE